MRQLCEDCGEPGRVQILQGYRAGSPVVRFLCMQCADQTCSVTVKESAGVVRGRLSAGATLVLGGVCLGLLVIFRQQIGLGEISGLGGGGRLIASLGALLVLLGALLQVDVVGVLGTLVFGVAAGTNLIGLANAEHVGLVSSGGLAASVGLIVAGLIVRRRAS